MTLLYKPSLVTSRWLARFNKDQYHHRIAVNVCESDTTIFFEYVSQDVLEIESKKWAVGCWWLKQITFLNGPGPVHTSSTIYTHLQ